MKKNRNYCLLIGILICFGISCKDDLSTLDVHKLPNIEVDTVGQSTITVNQFDKFELDPKIKLEGITEADLEYEWSVNTTPQKTNYVTIGDTKKLSFEVNLLPNASLDAYQLRLKVTDKKNNLDYLMGWPLNVKNGIGEGVVVVETYDGVSTDFSHLMSPLVTPDYDKETIRYRILSGVNGHTIDGLVTQLRYTRSKPDGTILLGSTARSLFSVKTLDYSLGADDQRLFYTPQPSYGASYLTGMSQFDVAVINGRLFSTWLQLGSFGAPFSTPYIIPDIMVTNAFPGDVNVRNSFYIEKEGLFAYQSSMQVPLDREIYPIPASTNGPFNPAAVVNKLNVAAGVNTDMDFLHLLKDKSTGKYELYVLEKAGWHTTDWYVIPSRPKARIDLSAAPEIDKAEHFLLLDNQKVILYATKQKIYAVMYGTQTATYSLRYTLQGADEITALSVYQQANYPMAGPPYFERNNKQLLMGTHDGTGGKVHILPLINEGVANIDVPNIKVYDGFGKIIKFVTQL